MIFTKNDIGSVFLTTDCDNLAELFFKSIMFAIRQGFTTLDIDLLDSYFQESQENDGALSDDAATYVELVASRAIDYLNDNCTDGVQFDIDLSGFHISNVED